MKISLAITVCNELDEIQKLLPFLINNKREEDEIHFRSSDDGELCHISRHELGAVKRNYFSYEKPDYFDFCIPLTNWRPFSISEEKGENHPIFLSKNIFDKQKKTFKTI